MFLVLFSTLVATAAPCLETTFEFTGQPDCVELTYADGRTQLNNTCPHALLLDQSVQLPGSTGSLPLVQAHASTQIKDLSAFTMGMNGKLYKVVAVVTVCEERTVANKTEDTRR